MKTQLKQNQIPKMKKSNTTELTQTPHSPVLFIKKIKNKYIKKRHCSIFWPKKLKINHTTLPVVDLVSICRIWCWSVKKKIAWGRATEEREVEKRDSVRRESHREEEREIEKRELTSSKSLREWEAREREEQKKFIFFYRKQSCKTINSKISYFFNSFPLTKR